MDERTDVSAAFALRLSADLITLLVLQGVLTKPIVGALIKDALSSLLDSHPEHEQSLRDIAATVTAQIGLASVDLEWKQKRDHP